ncbi:MAG TPA: metal-dependent hydrolase [Noviherbaspirillum sp.]|jgi:inner membrane protein|uniref:metal-dependent hydrolase n=1 Tax=Noviherbaspirillum sp. TaxID=1926288 RepID=UPI002DDD9C6F|nr:metal-dependent hydrolase [Noviherbaspirillum sp.]HEV2611123.1 metal-dependent hydrolase [Noviherbaspirillum sp.]
MDNLSHSVVGLAAGELIHRSLPVEQDSARHDLRRTLLLVSCWLASNFPDLDLVLTPLLPEPLGYLLHHRGHTHTLLYAIPQALLLWALLWLLWPAARRLLKASQTARAGLALSLTAGFLLHMSMDYLNSYGIHPFHPFDSRWFYGDMVFILEPLFWIAFGIPMAMMIRTLWLRALLILALLAIPVYFTMHNYLPWVSMAVLAAIAAPLGLLQRRAGAQGIAALALAMVIGAGFVGLQGVASNRARQFVAEALHTRDPASRLVDASMTSFPTNPVCWSFVSVESNEEAGTYRLRRGLVSTLPDTVPVTRCPAALSDRKSQKEMTASLALFSEQVGQLAVLRELRKDNCHFEAWLRFARAPAVSDIEAMDLRYSASPQGNFTTMRFEDFKHRACPTYVPQWNFPRLDLLTPLPPDH